MTPRRAFAVGEYVEIGRKLGRDFDLFPLTRKERRSLRYNAAMRRRNVQAQQRRVADRARTSAFVAEHGDPNRDPANRRIRPDYFWMPGLYDGKGKRRKKIFDILISRRASR